MNRMNLTGVAAGAGVLLGLLLALQAGAQGQSGGARPSGAASGAGNAGGLGATAIGVDRGWPRAPEIAAPSRLPQDKAFGEKGDDSSAKKAASASSTAAANAERKSTAAADCAEAKAAIAAAGTGSSTGKGQGGAAGAEGRAKAAEAVCSGADAEVSTKAPGHTGVTGQAQAIIRADDHANDDLEKAPGGKESDKSSEHGPPQ